MIKKVLYMKNNHKKNIIGSSLMKMRVLKKYDFSGFNYEVTPYKNGKFLAHLIGIRGVSAVGVSQEDALYQLSIVWELIKECYQEDNIPIPQPKHATPHIPSLLIRVR